MKFIRDQRCEDINVSFKINITFKIKSVFTRIHINTPQFFSLHFWDKHSSSSQKTRQGAMLAAAYSSLSLFPAKPGAHTRSRLEWMIDMASAPKEFRVRER